MITEQEMDARLKTAEEISNQLMDTMYKYLEHKKNPLSTEEVLLGITLFYQSIVMTQYEEGMELSQDQRDEIINKILAQFSKDTYLEDCVVTLVEALNATLMQLVTT